MPRLVRTHSVLRGPTVTEVADELGLRAQGRPRTFDVVVLGAGPAGLASAVYASSEGLSTLVIERFAPGGQAGTSARIENYLGFPTGLSGSELTHGRPCRLESSAPSSPAPTKASLCGVHAGMGCGTGACGRPARCAPASSCSPSAPTIAACRPTGRALRGPRSLRRGHPSRGAPGGGRGRGRGRRRQLGRAGGGQPASRRSAASTWSCDGR